MQGRIADNTYYSVGVFVLILNDLSKHFNYQVNLSIPTNSRAII